MYAGVRRSHRALLFLAAASIAIAAAHAVDGWAFRHVVWSGVYDSDLGRMLRIFGFAPFWLLAAAALILNDRHDHPNGRRAPAYRRGALLTAAVAAGGLLAELLKLLLRRERAWAHDGAYVFRPFAERTFSTGGLALPSSHALVAFAAAAMLARLFPRARVIWYAAATGCAVSRILAGAHFVSDVVVAAVAGWLAAAFVWRYAAARTASQKAAFLQDGARRDTRVPNLESR